MTCPVTGVDAHHAMLLLLFVLFGIFLRYPKDRYRGILGTSVSTNHRMNVGPLVWCRRNNKKFLVSVFHVSGKCDWCGKAL